jgi:hypothetical protein
MTLDDACCGITLRSPAGGFSEGALKARRAVALEGDQT